MDVRGKSRARLWSCVFVGMMGLACANAAFAQATATLPPHKSVEAAKASFDAFRQDPDWIAARKASEEKAAGSLTVKDGVKSVFMRATDYSPIR